MLPGMAGGMVSKAGVKTAPTVQGTATYVSTGASTSHTLNLPSGIQSGDMLFVFYQHSASGADLSSLPSGWLYYTGSPMVKIATGSEGTTLATSWDASGQVSAVAIRISGNRNGTSTSEIARSSLGASYDPPSLTPTWGIENNLWMVACQVRETNATAATWPTGFTSNQTSAVHASAACAVHVAFKEEEASVLDPSAFTINNVDGFSGRLAHTFAIRPL